MCIGCYEEYGRPFVWNSKVAMAAELIEAVYEHNSVGGNLHAILDDWNIEDEHVSGELTDYHQASPEQWRDELACLGLLREMSLEERASALAVFDKFVEAPDA